MSMAEDPMKLGNPHPSRLFISFVNFSAVSLARTVLGRDLADADWVYNVERTVSIEMHPKISDSRRERKTGFRVHGEWRPFESLQNFCSVTGETSTLVYHRYAWRFYMEAYLCILSYISDARCVWV